MPVYVICKGEVVMESDILSIVRKINWILQEAPTGAFSFNELCEILSKQSDSNVYIVNSNGKLLGVHYMRLQDKSDLEFDEASGSERVPQEYNERLLKITETMANVQDESLLEIFPEDELTKEKYHTFIPIQCGGHRWGTMFLTRYEPAYTDEDLALAEIGATSVALEIQRLKNIEAAEDKREEEVVKMALRTLSYSESEAAIRIFEELDGDEGILVASRVADQSRITRSVIVNALRKLESAGVIESKSLGMKGTHIKVLNRKFDEELEKMKNQ